MNSIALNKLRIFLVEDIVDLREEIIFGLNALGLDASGFGDAASLYRTLAAKDCDIVVVDVGLPGESGFSIAEHLRGNPVLGIVFLTSHALLEDRLRGLSLGADAYLLKPIDLRELAATLHAVSRRLRATPDIPLAAAWSLEQGGWALRNPQGKELTVSNTERRFLEIMVASSGQVVGREN